jgi:hypothetical protein
MEELAESLNLDAGYGGIRIGKVDNGFNNINVTSSYGQVALGLNNASYSIDANCAYCGISYPESNFQEIKSMKITPNHQRQGG